MAGQEDQDDGDEDDRQTLLSAVALALAPSAGERGGIKRDDFSFILILLKSDLRDLSVTARYIRMLR